MKIRFFASILPLVLFFFAWGCSEGDGGKSVQVGVLLPKSGLADIGYEQPLEWVVENVNRAGGVAGKKLELVWKDLGKMESLPAARELLDDENILAVIGTDSSGDTFELAPLFIDGKKILITPAATSAHIFRAFAGEKYIWRTLESDVAQLRTMFVIAASEEIRKVALLTSTDTYGATFFDWFGFFATEFGMEITAIEQYDQEAETCDAHIRTILESGPEMFFAVPSDPESGICMVNAYDAYRKAGGTAEMLFSDGGTYASIVTETGGKAEGIRGLGMGYDLTSGFHYAFEKKFGTPPSAYAANCYDALMLIAYALERSGGAGGEALADALIEVVDARGEETGWDEDGIAESLAAIRSGQLPDITGTTGSLEYDAEDHTDLVRSIFGVWRITDGEFVVKDYIWSDSGKKAGAQSAEAIFKSIASDENMQNLDGGSGSDLPERGGLWAFILAASSGWDNYRHQADALAAYRLLRDNGLPDDRIVLILADDLAQNEKNSLPGVVRNEPNGPNLYADAEIDYITTELSTDDLKAILMGQQDALLPEVIDGKDTDNLYVFIVGHGSRSGVLMEQDFLAPDDLAETLWEMKTEGRFRQALVEIEACHGGVMGEELEKETWSVADTLLISGANGYENSLGALYDRETKAWTADQFARAFVTYAADNTDSNLVQLYEHLYHGVNGSHVSIYNYGRMGDLEQVYLRDFVVE